MNKLCPFRKIVCFMDNNGEEDFLVESAEAFFTKEDFLECYKDRCEMWSFPNNCCGLRKWGNP